VNLTSKQLAAAGRVIRNGVAVIDHAVAKRRTVNTFARAVRLNELGMPLLKDIIKPERLFSPPDVEQASDEWGANCGPAALAAITGRTLAQVRPVVEASDFEQRGYMNPTHVKTALSALGLRFTVHGSWVRRGLLFVQWGGPWLKPGVPIGAAYRNTHWIAVDGAWVYDVNASHTAHGGWIMRSAWDRPDVGLAAWIMQHTPRCDGTWTVRTGLFIEGGA
jgi:hypothetical protein